MIKMTLDFKFSNTFVLGIEVNRQGTYIGLGIFEIKINCKYENHDRNIHSAIADDNHPVSQD